MATRRRRPIPETFAPGLRHAGADHYRTGGRRRRRDGALRRFALFPPGSSSGVIFAGENTATWVLSFMPKIKNKTAQIGFFQVRPQ
jgi:hypothetical protein